MPAALPQLGKAPPRQHYGEVAAKLADFIEPKRLLPQVPASWQWGKGLEFPVYGNDTLPDCTCAAVGHHEQVWSARAGAPETPALEAVLEFFDYTGSMQGLGRNQGRYMAGGGIGVLDCWRNRGFSQAAPGVPAPYERILGYAVVNQLDLAEVRAAGYLFGGLYAGLALPLSAAYQWQGQGGVWSLQHSNNAPGSWGGHAVNITAYGTYITCATWGRRWRMSKSFFRTYCDELYVALSPDWVQAGAAPSGYDQAGLLGLLTQL